MTRDETVPYLNGEVPVQAGAERTNGNGADIHEQTQDAAPREVSGIINTDAIVVGGGFSGITAIDRLRKAGKQVKCFESGDDFGGVWYWNRCMSCGCSWSDLS